MSSYTQYPMLGRNIKGMTGTGNADSSLWPTPDLGALPPEKLSQYLSRKKALEMYFDGKSDSEIHSECQIKIKQVYRLITERCLAVHPDGLIYGWRGLLPNLRIKPYQRKRKIQIDTEGRGGAGAMSLILEMHPDVKEKLISRVLQATGKKSIGPVKRPNHAHWRWFLNELSKLGYEAKNEWPFNTKTRAYQSIYRFIDVILMNNPDKAYRVIGGPDMDRKMISSDGVKRPIFEVYERVEMDAHKVDGIFCVLLPDSLGGHVPKRIHRIWVIVMIDVVSRAVLGYHLSLNKEVNKEDILKVIKKSLSLWIPREISFGDAYIEGAGFPASISEKFLRACWNETLVDGALAENCKHVRETLRDVVGSVLTTPSRGFSSRRSKDDRPFIEAFFRHLGVYGFQRISNTTGKRAGDTSGRDPGLVAENCRFQFEYAEELIDVIIANYNATPHSSLNYRSPLQYLQFASSRQDLNLRYADPNSIQSLLSFGKKCRVKGGFKEGKKPYVNFFGAKYSSEIIAQRYDLIGKEVWISNHIEEDARIVKISLLNGVSLGTLRSAPPWHRLPHTLSIRRAIKSCLDRKIIHLSKSADAIESFLEYCEGQKSKKLPIHASYLELKRLLTNHKSTIQTPINNTQVNSDNAVNQENGKNIESIKPNIPKRRMALLK